FSCALGTVAANGTVVKTVTYTVPASTTASPQDDTAAVSSTTTDPDTSDNSATDSNTVLTSANLSVRKADGGAGVAAGDGVTRTYTITVHNAGPSDAQAVSLSDTWPTGFTRGLLPAGCVDVGGGPDFSCALGTVASGATVMKSVTYTVPASTTASPQDDTATVSSTTSDPDTTNNSATDSNTVLTSANLSV